MEVHLAHFEWTDSTSEVKVRFRLRIAEEDEVDLGGVGGRKACRSDAEPLRNLRERAVRLLWSKADEVLRLIVEGRQGLERGSGEV